MVLAVDRGEAFPVADEIAVTCRGRIVPCGTSGDLCRSPVDLEATRLAGAAVSLGGRPARNPRGVPDRPAALMLRPEQTVEAPAGAGVRVRVLRAPIPGPLAWLDL